MKRSYIILFTLLSVVFFNCQKETSADGFGDRPGSGTKDPITATVQGNVIDENGAPASGVSVKVGNKMVQTDSKGSFRIINALLDKGASLVTAEKSGYFKSYRTFQAMDAANHVKIKLVKRKLAGTISAAGGEVTLDNGSKVFLPANAVVKAAGGSYAGDVRVYAAYIDPSANDIDAAVPGSFMADNSRGDRVVLASYGMMAVELESASSEKLQIADDKEAVLTMPIPASLQASAPASISLWYVNEETGIWKEEGKAERSGNTYTGRVKHFTFWNCDIGLPTVTLTLSLKNEKGLPLVHTGVRLKGMMNGALTQAYGFTDSIGSISGLVLAGQTLTLEVVNDQCNNVVYTTTVGPFSSNTNIGTITISSVNTSIVAIKGKLISCAAAPVINGTAMITVGNSNYYVSTNQQGEFSMAYIKCGTSQQAVSITGIDNLGMQQGTAANFSIGTSPELNAGNLVACGISASQFLNYTVDGTNYQLNNLNASDSLTYYAFPTQQPSAGFVANISGFNMTSARTLFLSFFSPTQAAGTYPVNGLAVNQFGGVSLISPTTVTVSGYPQVVGEFMEGSFTGSFRDSVGQGPVRTINGSFRLRRQQ
ncbi:MAG: carboxypeptidase-like regulatory domain-containing protein [Chitinophagaceae bacterium]